MVRHHRCVARLNPAAAAFPHTPAHARTRPRRLSRLPATAAQRPGLDRATLTWAAHQVRIRLGPHRVIEQRLTDIEHKT